jgi:hypothetical protein
MNVVFLPKYYLPSAVRVPADEVFRTLLSDIDIFVACPKDDDHERAIRRLYDFAVTQSWTIDWGPYDLKSFYCIGNPEIAKDPFISVWFGGNLQISFDALKGNEIAERARDSLAAFATAQFPSALTEMGGEDGNEYHFVIIDGELWVPYVEALIIRLRSLTKQQLTLVS